MVKRNMMKFGPTEDEADGIGENTDKRDMLKAGYTSGRSVPMVELEGRRTRENWLWMSFPGA